MGSVKTIFKKSNNENWCFSVCKGYLHIRYYIQCQGNHDIGLKRVFIPSKDVLFKKFGVHCHKVCFINSI